MKSLPLFDTSRLAAIKADREALLRKLRNVRMDAHSRIRTQRKLALLTAEQVRLERVLYGEPRR
ncbi:hypothetical protein ABIA22_000367 [Sinorhizobium fredii]